MSVDFDPYITLGIADTATPNEVKSAYHRAAKRLHPDVNHTPGAVVQFQDITAAYELLMDIEGRIKFDEQRRRRPADPLTFSLRVIPSKRSIAQISEPQVIYLLAELTPDPRAQQQVQKRDSRMNLTLVLDRSNSMNASWLDKVKVAAHQIIDQLNSDDILSVIAFNDRAEVIIPATTVADKPALKARISMMSASGGTEMFQGLAAGIEQVQKYLAPRLVNHVLLLTDGNTFGDEERCLKLAQGVKKQGIVISAMGLGEEWNDDFLEQLTSSTGGTCEYIRSANKVARFLNDHVRNLTQAFAERMQISVAPDPDIILESAFKLAPSPSPLPITDGNIPLGSLQVNRPISILFQFEVAQDLALGFRPIARVVASGDILANDLQSYQALSDLSLEIAAEPTSENPPTAILDALGKLTLYRMQERANEALERGDIREATHRLERLATRLLQLGEPELAGHARDEAQRVARTSQLSDRGKKTLKFQTRYLLEPAHEE
jgi:Ca-activated chloride channel family protein